jgi:hypothetical protein
MMKTMTILNAAQIHAHCAVGFPDGQMRGGHLLEAIAWLTVEVFFTSCPTPLIKEHDDETDLSLFDLKWSTRQQTDDSSSDRQGHLLPSSVSDDFKAT